MGSSVFGDGNVTSLLKKCLLMIVKDVNLYLEAAGSLPPSLKEKILLLMCKRGLVTDENIDNVLIGNIRSLDLSHCELSDVGLQKIATTCRNLCKIDLNALKTCRTNISTTGISTLAQRCPYLQVVYLRRCISLTDDAVINLSQHCRMLRDLNLGGCSEITDLSLQALGENCPALRSIDISRAQVTDEGLFHLANGVCSHTLKEIHMNHCSALTDESIEAVIQYCPNLAILLFHGCPNMTDQSRIALEEMMTRNKNVKQVTWTVY